MIRRRSSSLFNTSPNNPSQELTLSDDEKVEQVVHLIRKLIVKKGRLDDLIQELDPIGSSPRGSIIKDKRWNAYIDLGMYMNDIATEEGRLLSSHHFQLFNMIKEKDEAVAYISRLLAKMKGQQRSLVATQVNNVNNYNFNLNLSLTLGDSTTEILDVVGSTVKWVILSLPKILDKVAGLPNFFRRCQNFFTGANTPPSTSTCAVPTSQIATGICIFNAWCKWKNSKSKSMLDFVLPLAEQNLKQLETAPEPGAYISDLMSAAFISIIMGSQNGNGHNHPDHDPQALAEAYTLLDSKKGDTLELINSRLRRLCIDYHPDRMIGKSPEEIAFGRETFSSLFSAFEVIQSHYDYDKEKKEQSSSNNGDCVHITDVDGKPIPIEEGNGRGLFLPWHDGVSGGQPRSD